MVIICTVYHHESDTVSYSEQVTTPCCLGEENCAGFHGSWTLK